MPLMQPAENRDRREITLERSLGGLKPAGGQFTIAVHELHEFAVRMELERAVEAGVAAAGRGEWPAQIQLDDFDAERLRKRGTAVG